MFDGLGFGIGIGMGFRISQGGGYMCIVLANCIKDRKSWDIIAVAGKQ